MAEVRITNAGLYVAAAPPVQVQITNAGVYVAASEDDAVPYIAAHANDSRTIEIVWVDNGLPGDSYDLQHSLNDTDWDDIDTFDAGVYTYTHEFLDPLSTHYYRVRSTIGGIDGSWSLSDQVDTPHGLSISAVRNSGGTSPRSIATTGIEDGDIVLLATHMVDNVVPTMPAGFTLIDDSVQMGTSDGIRVYYKIASGEPGSYSISWTGGNTSNNILLAVRSDTGRPLDIGAAASQTNSSSTNRDWPAITAPGGAYLLACFASLISNIASSPDSQMTEQSDTGGPRAYLMTQLVTSSGSSGTRTATGTASISKTATIDVEEVGSIPAPDAPTDLTATADGENAIDLTWTDNSDDEIGFAVERSSNGTSGWVLRHLTAPDEESYTDTGLTAATHYYYRVRAKNAGGYSSPSSDDTTTDAPVPAAPDNAHAVSFSTSQINLDWDDNSPYETGFQIEQSLDGSTGWTLIHTTAANATTYSVTGLDDGTRYYFRIRAHNDTGDSSYASTVNAYTAVAAPTNLVAIGVDIDEIDLTWDDNSVNETGYEIQRSPNGTSSWTTVTTTAANAESYSNTGLSSDTTYYYRVRAVGISGAGNSAFSNVDHDATFPAVPTTPSSLAAAAISDSQIDLTWNDNSSDETGFKIEQSANGTTGWTLIHTTAANVESYSVTSLAEGVQYYYRIIGVGSGGDSAPSNVANDTTWLSAPDDLSVTAFSETEIDLTWNDHSTHEDAFAIEYSNNGTTGWTFLLTVPANTVTYQDTGLVEGTTRYYRVKATGTHDSLYSEVEGATTPLFAPTDLDVDTVDSTELHITWTDNSTGGNTYTVERSPDGDDPWTIIASGILVDNYFDNDALDPSTPYYYRVQSHIGPLSSEYSNIGTAVTADPPPTAPYNLRIDAVSETKVRITWNFTITDQDPYISGFRIEHSTNGSSWSEVDSVDQYTRKFTHTGLTANTLHYYRVRTYRD